MTLRGRVRDKPHGGFLSTFDWTDKFFHVGAVANSRSGKVSPGAHTLTASRVHVHVRGRVLVLVLALVRVLGTEGDGDWSPANSLGSRFVKGNR